jgi:cell division protein FtsW
MKQKFNYSLFFLIAFLSVFSLLFFYTLSTPASMQRFGDPSYYFSRHLFFGFLPAIFFGVLAFKVPLKFIKKISIWLVAINILALFLVFIPFLGITAGGATRWFNFRIFSVQPSEFLKITAILYLSAWIASKLPENQVSGWKSVAKRSYYNIIYILFPFIIFLGIITVALYFQSDASTLAIIGLTLLIIYFSSKTPLWHTLSIVSTGLMLGFLLIKFSPYRMSRLFIFLNPDADPLGKGYQLRQSLISLGSGGIFGRGLGMSTQKFGFLPQAMADSIFAIIGEELGIIGSVSLVILFILFFWLGIKIAKKSGDRFGRLAATGIVFWITLQAFINISSTIGIFPLTGVPLPFFSYGGSHLVVEFIAVGLLLNISKNT